VRPQVGVAAFFAPCEAVEANGLGGAAEHPDAERLDGSGVAEATGDGVGEDGLPGRGRGGDAGGEVDGVAEVVASSVDRRTAVDADAQAGQCVLILGSWVGSAYMRGQPLSMASGRSS